MMEQMSLFDDRKTSAPLASRLRPETLDEYVGQQHLLGPGKLLRQLIEKDQRTFRMFTIIPAAASHSLAEVMEESGNADAVGRQPHGIVGHHVVVHLKCMGAHATLVAVVAVALCIEVSPGLKGINNVVHPRTVHTPQKGDHSFFPGHHKSVVCNI